MEKPSSNKVHGALKFMMFPKVLALKGKHETTYYLVANLDDLWEASLEVLRRRVEQDRYIGEPMPEPYGLQAGELSDEEVAVLPEPYRDLAKKIRFTNRKIRREHQEAVDEWAEVQRALLEQDGRAAWEILYNRSTYEYEGFVLEDLRVAGESKEVA